MTNAAHAFRLVALVMVQLVFFTNLPLSVYGNPYIYIIGLLWLPFRINLGVYYAIAFAVGTLLDSMEQSGGAHTAACLTMAALRRPVVMGLLSYKATENVDFTLSRTSLMNFATATPLLVLAHHFVLFLFENGSLSFMGSVLLRTLLSSILTYVVILIIQGLFAKPNES